MFICLSSFFPTELQSHQGCGICSLLCPQAPERHVDQRCPVELSALVEVLYICVSSTVALVTRGSPTLETEECDFKFDLILID